MSLRLLAVWLATLLAGNPFFVPVALAQEETVAPSPEEEVAAEQEAEEAEVGEEEEEEIEEEVVEEVETEEVVAEPTPVIEETVTPEATTSAEEAKIETGDALAYANVLNVTNADLADTEFEIQLLDFPEDHQGSIDFNEVWEEFVDQAKVDPSLFQIVESNLAALENEVMVEANSGGNKIEASGSAQIQTGSATALANLINLVNLNLVDSQFLLSVINILDDFEGDLIFPAPEKFKAGEISSEENLPVATNQNEAVVDNEVVAAAFTGDNEIEASGSGNVIETGDAQAQANAVTVANANIQHHDWFFLMINNLSPHLGQVLGWSSPDAAEPLLQGEPNIFQTSAPSPASDEPESLMISQDQAVVTSKVTAVANTGGNQIKNSQGGSWIETGQARALANSINLVNTNLVGSRWFMGLVNIFGDWQGRVIFAYPDVTVKLTNDLPYANVGDQVTYHLDYQNQGYETASQVWLQLVLPEGIEYVGGTSSLTPTLADHTSAWFLGDLAAGQSGAFDVTVQINQDFQFDERQISWLKLIPQVLAAENELSAEMEMSASIATTDLESDLVNNTATIKTLIYKEQTEVDQGAEQEATRPVLVLSAKNNVGEFVYPGDVVTFEIKLRNTGGQTARDVYLTQELTNNLPEESFGAAFFPVGDLAPGQAVTLNFGVKLFDEGLFGQGWYHTYAQAVGFDAQGEEIASNQAATEFYLRLKPLETFWETKAINQEEEVLGVFESQCPSADKTEEILAYLLVFLLSSLSLVERSRRLFQLKNER